MTVWMGVVSCWPGIVSGGVVVIGVKIVVIVVVCSRVSGLKGSSATSRQRV